MTSRPELPRAVDAPVDAPTTPAERLDAIKRNNDARPAAVSGYLLANLKGKGFVVRKAEEAA